MASGDRVPVGAVIEMGCGDGGESDRCERRGIAPSLANEVLPGRVAGPAGLDY